jgi:hypothetical protein
VLCLGPTGVVKVDLIENLGASDVGVDKLRTFSPMFSSSQLKLSELCIGEVISLSL